MFVCKMLVLATRGNFGQIIDTASQDLSDTYAWIAARLH